MAQGFTENDDRKYADLVDNNVIAASNPLFNLKPSDLNFTSNCWATGDIVWLSSHPEEGDESSRQQSLSNDIRAALPSQQTNISTHLVYEYFHALQALPEFIPIMNETFNKCNTTNKLLTPVSDIDFTRDCSATGTFWWHLWTLKPRNDSLVPLLRASMPLPYATMSNNTLRTIARGVRSTTSKKKLRPEYRPLLENAAKTCAREACLNLNFEGNADIAGIGVRPVFT